MIYIENSSTDAAFHFSTEDFLMRHFGSEPVLMVWQADRCVMLGANQVAHTEVDMEFAGRENIKIVRRGSGGGAIFTDMGTLLYSFIQPYRELENARQAVGETVAAALKGMGVPAALEGRNDILAGGKKISGIAQQVRHGRVCTHGSLLYDTDLDMLAGALRADGDKIQSKAIRSVRSRVGNISEYMGGLSVGDFREGLLERLFCGFLEHEYRLTERDLGEIEGIYNEKYNNPAWTFGKSPAFTFKNGRRFPGGRVDIYLDTKNGIVSSCAICGDFLATEPVYALEAKLENILFDYRAFYAALEGVSLGPYLGDISKEQFLSCIFGKEADGL